MNSSFNDFINYCLSFYGHDGLYSQTDHANKSHMQTCIYLDAIAHYDSDTYTWGDGDSLDRERVRDIMNQIYDGGYNPFQHLTEEANA